MQHENDYCSLRSPKNYKNRAIHKDEETCKGSGRLKKKEETHKNNDMIHFCAPHNNEVNRKVIVILMTKQVQVHAQVLKKTLIRKIVVPVKK